MTTNLYLRLRLNFANFFFLLILLTGSSGLYAQPDSTLFRDDFNRSVLGSFWEAHPSWSIVNGSAYNFIDGTGGTLLTATGYSQTSYIIETRAKVFNPAYSYHRDYRITFGQADLSNYESYQVIYNPDGRLTLSRLDNLYNSQILDEAAIYPRLNSSQWYKFKIARYKSGLIQVYIDKGSGYGAIPFLEAIDLSYPVLGHTGWLINTETSAEDFFVDWISASKAGVEKPAIKEKPVEDNLITQVSAKSGKPYKVAKLVTGVRQLIDRDYTITSVPEYLKGASFIQAANADKNNTSDNFLSFFLKTSAIVYIGYDSRNTAIPEWLKKWTKTGDQIGTSDMDVNYLDVYSRFVERTGEIYPSPVIAGGNLASPATGAKTNYLIAAILPPHIDPLQAEDALLSGAVAANDHLNYNGTGFADFKNPFNDYIEWTVQIDVSGTYTPVFRFAHAGPGNRSLQITDNGVSTGTAVFNPISSTWDTWATNSGPNIFLAPGVHKIRLTAMGKSGPNIDELSLYYLSDTAVAAPMVLARTAPANGTFYKLPGQSDKAYPNPFVQHTNIYYDLKEKAKVTLSVYTLQGQQIQLLDNKIREAGHYQATFNAGKVAKGIYFYRLQIGNDIRIGKLIKE